MRVVLFALSLAFAVTQGQAQDSSTSMPSHTFGASKTPRWLSPKVIGAASVAGTYGFRLLATALQSQSPSEVEANTANKLDYHWEDAAPLTLCSEKTFQLLALASESCSSLTINEPQLQEQGGYCADVIPIAPGGRALLYFNSDGGQIDSNRSTLIINGQPTPLAQLKPVSQETSVRGKHLTLISSMIKGLDLARNMPVRLDGTYLTWRQVPKGEQSGKGGRRTPPPSYDKTSADEGATGEAVGRSSGTGGSASSGDNGGDDPKKTIETDAKRKRDLSLDEQPLLQLFTAAFKGHLAVVELLLANGVNPNIARDNGTTPLWCATQNGHQAVVELLLAKGADPNLAKNDGATPLFEAAFNGNEAIVRLLLANGADSNLAKNNGATPLLGAASNGHGAVVELLLANGAAPNLVKNNSATPLLGAAFNGHEAIVDLLLTSGADPNLAKNNSPTPLLGAALNGQEAIVDLLLTNGADPNLAKKDNGATPLIGASSSGHEAIVRLLLAKGADPNLTNKYNGATPLLGSANNGHEAIVELLLANGADPNQTKNDGATPLFKAAFNGHEAIVELLLANGVDPNQTENDGATPLFKAAFNGHEAIVELLLANGADSQSG